MKEILTITRIRKSKKDLYLGLVKRGLNNITSEEKEMVNLLLRDKDILLMIVNQHLLSEPKK